MQTIMQTIPQNLLQWPVFKSFDTYLELQILVAHKPNNECDILGL